MTSAEIIEQIQNLPPDELAEVASFVRALRDRPLMNGKELTDLAEQLGDESDPEKTADLKRRIAAGFYGAE